MYLQRADDFRVVAFRKIADQLDAVVLLLFGESVVVAGRVRDELVPQLHQSVQVGLRGGKE